jgi:hypothetical protein
MRMSVEKEKEAIGEIYFNFKSDVVFSFSFMMNKRDSLSRHQFDFQFVLPSPKRPQ